MGRWIMRNVASGHGLGCMVSACHNQLTFRKADGDERSYLQRGVHCQKPLLCQVCAQRLGAQRLRELLPKARLLGLRENYVFTFGTLTGPRSRVSPDELPAAAEELLGTFAAWWKCSRPGKNRAPSALSDADGIYAKFEVTWSTPETRRWSCRKFGHNEHCLCEDEGSWYHPHIHPLIASKYPLDFGGLNRSWRKSGGGHPHFKLTRASYKYSRGQMTPAEFGGPDGIIKDLLEVTKYTVKFSGMPKERVWDVFMKLGNGEKFQLSRTLGVFRCKERPVEFEDSGQPDWKVIPYDEFVYWRALCSAANPLGLKEKKRVDHGGLQC